MCLHVGSQGRVTLCWVDECIPVSCLRFVCAYGGERNVPTLCLWVCSPVLGSVSCVCLCWLRVVSEFILRGVYVYVRIGF